MIDGLRLISSDSVDFGIKCIESDFIRNIINDTYKVKRGKNVGMSHPTALTLDVY